mmetsp:Transcript_39103/g.110503  ORF Transcript_39103/g.110503 Transcript_39103/m.110503 type:complete len:386 (-) Transcript_39103:84-1241(-)
MRGHELGGVGPVHAVVFGGLADAPAAHHGAREVRRVAVRGPPRGAPDVQQAPLLRPARGLPADRVGVVVRLRGRPPAVPRAEGRPARRRRQALRGPPGGDGDVRGGGRRLRRLRVERVGRLREDVRGRPAAPAPPDPRVPAARGQGVPHGAGADPRVQRGGLQRQRLRALHLGRVGALLHVLRWRAAEPPPRGAPQATTWRAGLQGGPLGDEVLPRELPVPGDRLRVARVVGVGRLHQLVRRRPDDPEQADKGDAEGGRRAVRPEGPGGGRGVQHAALRGAGVRERRVGRLGQLVALLPELRRGREVPHARCREDGRRVRGAGERQGQGHRVLQRGHVVRPGAGLRVHRVGNVERLLHLLQRHQEALAAHREVRAGRRRLLHGRA